MASVANIVTTLSWIDQFRFYVISIKMEDSWNNEILTKPDRERVER